MSAIDSKYDLFLVKNIYTYDRTFYRKFDSMCIFFHYSRTNMINFQLNSTVSIKMYEL